MYESAGGDVNSSRCRERDELLQSRVGGQRAGMQGEYMPRANMCVWLGKEPRSSNLD